MSGDVVDLPRLMRHFFEQHEKWSRFTYGDVSDVGIMYVYHNNQILALIGYTNVVIRAPGSYYNYCGTLTVPMFERFLPEHPDFLTQVSNAIDIGMRLIESGKTDIS